MTRGRKPKADAIRRGGHGPATPAELVAVPIGGMEPAGPEKPANVARNPTMSECWDRMVAKSGLLGEEDVPLLEAYCFWYAVLRQAESSVVRPDGAVATVHAAIGEDGEVDYTTAIPNPDLKTAEKATAMLRQLGDALAMTPTARIRSGLMRAMTASTVAGLVKQTDEGFAKFLEMQERRALSDGS